MFNVGKPLPSRLSGAYQGVEAGMQGAGKGQKRALRKRTRGKTDRNSQEPGPSSSKIEEIEEIDGSDTEPCGGVMSGSGDESDTDSEGSLVVPTKIRKRGRPPTTGDHLMAQKKREHKREIRMLREERRALKEIMDPRVLPRPYMRDSTPERELRDQFLSMAPERIAANMLDSIKIVEKVARRSKNLKGTYVKELVNSTNALRAAVMAFTQKAAASTQEATIPEKSRGENGGLRERVRGLESQLAKAESEKAKAEDKSRPGQEEAEMQLDVGEAETLPPPAPKITEAKRPVVIIKRIEPFKGAVKVLRPEVQGRKKEMGESREEAMEGGNVQTPSQEEQGQGRGEEAPSRGEKADDRDVSRQTRSDRKKGGKSGGRVDEAKGTSTKPDKEMPKPQRVPRQAQTKTLQKEEQLREKKADPPQRKGNYAEAAKKPAKRAQPAEGNSAPQRPKGSNEAKNAPKRKEAATQPAAGKGRGPEQRNRRTPRSEAVSIMFPAGEFAQGMRDIRSKVNLDELGIGPLKQRKALTGALILEVAGADKLEKANLLAEHIRKAVGNKEGVRQTVQDGRDLHQGPGRVGDASRTPGGDSQSWRMRRGGG
ncbi:PREDICTED: uncharacterized protein LOC105556972 [Vollenhovia emeryi]|uniref:uncharacterized protein LOC105556972 n=1 Tax=Vollenhovia emeryi TaxID=411798 RepID=UPI0005F37A78|nr:PREDICTED: uncharacterized protein LOC105556972 [Vollenhovia emeryi]